MARPLPSSSGIPLPCRARPDRHTRQRERASQLASPISAADPVRQSITWPTTTSWRCSAMRAPMRPQARAPPRQLLARTAARRTGSRAVLAVYPVQPEVLAVKPGECRGPGADEVNGQDSLPDAELSLRSVLDTVISVLPMDTVDKSRPPS